MTISINVGQFPSARGVTPLTVEEGTTVAQAIARAELSTDGFDIRVNGQTATGEQVVNAGDSVLLVRKIKGNYKVLVVRKHKPLTGDQVLTLAKIFPRGTSVLFA